MATTLFITSGLAIVLLVAAKKLSEGRSEPIFILRAISMADIYLRGVYQHVVQYYSQNKEENFATLKNRLRLQFKSFLDKSTSYIREKRIRLLGELRNTRSLRQHENVSEFLRDVSSAEKEGENLNNYQNNSQNREDEVK